jgi:putative tryptophan/tyrosine transport system substrate-binding protein
MRRREFIAGLGGAAAAWPLGARAQHQPAMPVIGWLNIPAPGTMELFLPAFKQGLADTGYVVGRNVTIESREGGIDQLPALAADLVRRQVTVIAALGIRPAQAAKAATQSIPVVFAMVGDPVEFGLVASLNRPSGNLTGVTALGSEVVGKRLELLHKMVPTADPIAYLTRTVPVDRLAQANAQTAARVLGVRLLSLVGATESEIAAAFATIVEQRAGALLISSGAFSPAASDQIISLAGRYAVPTLFFTRDQVMSGGLASYGVPVSELIPRMGVYAGRILKGEKPADLPVMQPTKFEFVINLKTAGALGLTIPETLLATADEVIQ